MTFFKNKKKLILYLLCIVAAVLSVSMIVSICTVRVNLTLYVNGKSVGVVEDASTVETIRERVESDVSKVAYGETFSAINVTYGFAEGKEASLSDGDIYKALYVAALKDFRSAYGLYANDEFVAANVDPASVADAVSAVRAAAQGDEDSEVELTGTLEVKSLYYPASSLYSQSEITEMLLEKKNSIYRTVPANSASVISVDIDASEDEKMFLGADGGEVVSSYTDGDGVVTVSIKVTETVPYRTEYRKNDGLYVGTYEKAQDGADGEKEVLYRITYRDGVQEQREKVFEEITVEPVSKIIDEGTKTKPVTASKDKYIWPIKDNFVITDTYGGRTVYGEYSFHRAIDLAAPGGTPIYAADGGVVEKAEWSSSYGYYVMIKHDNGQETLYAHMRSEPFVSAGERVYQGQQIGEVGMTGFATGYHLHFEVRVDGERMNPINYLPER
jgi:murein DD-endopeptidase MepM/ murein hydrolase activator NlpD